MIKSEQAMLFFLDTIHRFGVPNSIITDNGTQFTGKKFLWFYNEQHIQVDWATVAHPRMNGQVERANDMLLQGLKPRIFNRLNKFGARWLTELPTVLWSLRTTSSRATGYTPFFMVYGFEAVLPTDLDYGAPKIRVYDERGAEASHQDAMDQQALRRYHNRRVRGRSFNVGDLVLCLVQSNKDRHKLSPP